MKFNLELTLEQAKLLVGVLGNIDMDATMSLCSSICSTYGGEVSYVPNEVDSVLYTTFDQLDDQLREIGIEVE